LGPCAALNIAFPANQHFEMTEMMNPFICDFWVGKYRTSRSLLAV
jgi:hypothetical protein